MEFKELTLEQALEQHFINQNKMAEYEDTMKRWAKDTESITINIRDEQQKAEKELRKVVEPMNRKLTKLQRKLQNKNIEMIKLTIKKHELEGVVKFLGGEIPKEFEVSLPEPVAEETMTEQLEREIGEGTAEVSPIFIPEHMKEGNSSIITSI